MLFASSLITSDSNFLLCYFLLYRSDQVTAISLSLFSSSPFRPSNSSLSFCYFLLQTSDQITVISLGVILLITHGRFPHCIFLCCCVLHHSSDYVRLLYTTFPFCLSLHHPDHVVPLYISLLFWWSLHQPSDHVRYSAFFLPAVLSWIKKTASFVWIPFNIFYTNCISVCLHVSYFVLVLYVSELFLYVCWLTVWHNGLGGCFVLWVMDEVRHLQCSFMYFAFMNFVSDTLLSSMFRTPGRGAHLEALPPLDDASQQLSAAVLTCLAHYFTWTPLSATLTPPLLSTIFHFAAFGCEGKSSRVGNGGLNITSKLIFLKNYVIVWWSWINLLFNPLLKLQWILLDKYDSFYNQTCLPSVFSRKISRSYL